MNLDLVKDMIKEHKLEKVHVHVKGMRNKSYEYDGIIKDIYPNLFVVNTLDGEKSISYSDIVIKDVKLTFFD